MKDYLGKDYSVLKWKKLWLFDMDGTIYLGDSIFDSTITLLDKIKANGGRYVFVTNNSSKDKTAYIEKLAKMGIDAMAEDFYTSADETAKLLKQNFNNSLIYAQGTTAFINGLKEEGLHITTEYDEKAKCVVVGYDTELTYKKLTDTCKMLKRDLPYYATNPDWVCPTEWGSVPDCGSMCFGIEKATGRTPIYIGKPDKRIIESAIEKFGFQRIDTVVVGDRIYTDIASAVNAGVDSVLVFSGESTRQTLQESEIKPTFALDSIKDICNIL